MKIDLLDVDSYRDGVPYDQYRWLRENNPVHWHDGLAEGGGFWALTRMSDIRAVELDAATFSSEPSTVYVDAGGLGNDDTHKHLIMSDPPHHTAHRQFLSLEFKPLPIRRAETQLRDAADQVIDEVIEQGECDLVRDVAGRYAAYVISDLIGLPREETIELFWAADVGTRGGSRDEGVGLEARTIMFKHAAAAYDMFKNGAPRDLILSRLAHGEIMGISVDERQFSMDFLLLVAAGSDTSRTVAAGGMLALMQNPGQFEALRANPDALMKDAIEEMLRWTCPVVYQRRTATTDTEIDGHKISEGQKVVMYYGAANRDPAAFFDPERFDITRSPNPHLTFGAGRHFCLGAPLARAELSILISEILARMTDLRQSGPASWPQTHVPPANFGVASIPVTFTPGPKVREQRSVA